MSSPTPPQKSLSPVTSDANDAIRSQATFRPGDRRPQVPSSDALAPPTSPSIITQRESPSHRSVGVAEEMVYHLGTPGCHPQLVSQSRRLPMGVARDSSMIVPGTHPMPLPPTRTHQELQSLSAGIEDSYCQVERFHIISVLSQNTGREPVLCLPNSFWSWPTADQDRIQPMSCPLR